MKNKQGKIRIFRRFSKKIRCRKLGCSSKIIILVGNHLHICNGQGLGNLPILLLTTYNLNNKEVEHFYLNFFRSLLHFFKINFHQKCSALHALWYAEDILSIRLKLAKLWPNLELASIIFKVCHTLYEVPHECRRIKLLIVNSVLEKKNQERGIFDVKKLSWFLIHAPCFCE